MHVGHLSHIISVLVIPNEFPRLLAKREIIANALFYQQCLDHLGRFHVPTSSAAKIVKSSHLHNIIAAIYWNICRAGIVRVLFTLWPRGDGVDFKIGEMVKNY